MSKQIHFVGTVCTIPTSETPHIYMSVVSLCTVECVRRVSNPAHRSSSPQNLHVLSLLRDNILTQGFK